MKKSSIIISIAALSGILLNSCSGVRDFDSVHGNSMGVVGKSHPATVINARTVKVAASSTTKNLSTVGGAVAGGALGNMLGGGSGNTLATAGGAILGGLAARGVSASAGQSYGQQLEVKVDGSRATYTITQPIYKQFGAIQPGTRGTLIESGNSSYFRPY